MTIAPVQNTSAFSGSSASVTLKLTGTSTHTFILPVCLPFGGSVESVTSTSPDRFIQAAYASSPLGGNAELWCARGLQGGVASVTVVCSTASVGVNLAEFSGLWFQSIIDTWSQNLGTGASVLPQTVQPRTTGDLLVTVANSSASISGPIGGLTALTVPGDTSYGAAYEVLSGSVAPTMRWNTAGGASWCAIECAFLPANSTTVGAATGPSGTNPLLQFPEVSVQICEAQNYLAPFQGIGSWTDVSSYVESMTLGPIGRQHELDRVQASAAQFVVNGRDGSFMPWNSQSFLWPGGLDPMTPIKVTAAWEGITSPIYYGYAQSFDPVIIDATNVNVNIAAYDILQMLSLGYLSNNNYAQVVLAGN